MASPGGASVVHDVAILSDFRYPGGTSASVAEEVRAQSRAGLSTVLLHVPASHLRTVSRFNQRIVDCLRRGEATLALPGDAVRARLLVVRHPRVLASEPDPAPRVEAEHVVMALNQAPRDTGSGRAHYDPSAVRERLERLFGPSEWAPIGPLVRQALHQEDPSFDIGPDDWVNIIDVAQWRVDRSFFPRARPVIGRFSRPDERKWPTTTAETLAAYPDTDDILVRVLGGGEFAVTKVGRHPRNWELLPFGTVDPRTFVRTIDFFVYFHSPRLVEAFGRTILEAMASGAPAILPHHFRQLFGDSAIYTDPAGVADIVRTLHGAPDQYEAQSRVATDYVAANFSYDTHIQRIERRIGSGAAAAPSQRHAVSHARSARTAAPPTPRPSRRVLMLSSNGAGLGHITRLMALARRLPPDLQAVVATQSQAAPLVQAAGFLTEYVPSRGYLDTTPERWNAFLRQRLAHLIDVHRPDTILVDGTVPYGGLLEAMSEHPELTWVWLRRAMWKQGLGREWLRRGAAFDHVLEPGDFSADADAGATVAHRHEARLVGPITYLDADELLDARSARAALGLSEGVTALIQLGAGNINDIQSPMGAMVARLQASGVEVVLAQSPIATHPLDAPEGVKVVVQYPLSRYFRAFDFTISAAGYNSFHECLRFGIPTVFAPNAGTALDDQVTRVMHAVRRGHALAMTDPGAPGAGQALSQILDPDVRATLGTRLKELERHENGAHAGAQWLAGLSIDADAAAEA